MAWQGQPPGGPGAHALAPPIYLRTRTSGRLKVDILEVDASLYYFSMFNHEIIVSYLLE